MKIKNFLALLAFFSLKLLINVKKNAIIIEYRQEVYNLCAIKRRKKKLIRGNPI